MNVINPLSFNPQNDQIHSNNSLAIELRYFSRDYNCSELSLCPTMWLRMIVRKMIPMLVLSMYLKS